MNHKILGLTETCTGCFACANACPKDAISLSANFEGFYFPIVETNKCINCGLCDKVCPQIMPQRYSTMQRAYYGWSKKDDIRKQSSSGGIFYHLSEEVLGKGGIVYGSSFNYSGLFRLECHSTKEVTIQELMRSKYVQSYIGYSFRQIKEELTSGILVLFCGTPCQVAGLKSFLRKEYSNLILVDFVCHGVPSIDLLQKHLEYIGINNVVDINFRPKNTGWVDDFEIQYKSKFLKSTVTRIRRIPWMFDEYFYMFETDKSIRRSCRNCTFCNGKRASDITIADFWGIKQYKPELWDPKGISLILVNTTSGLTLINDVMSNSLVYCKDLPLQYAKYVYLKERTSPDSPYQNRVRDKFLHDVYTIGYSKAIKKHCLKSSRVKLFIFKAKKIIRKLIKYELIKQ